MQKGDTKYPIGDLTSLTDKIVFIKKNNAHHNRNSFLSYKLHKTSL